VGLAIQEWMPYNSQYLNVTVIDSNGCIAADRILILVDKTRRVYVPNIFNPETNILTVYGGEEVVEIERFTIFDRWGEQLYERTGFAPNNEFDGWDGTYKGEHLPPGVYVFTVQVRFIDGKVQLLSGDVTIYR
jgi:gliding motility-associated-like protein